MAKTIILVDKQDNQIGTAEKLSAHKQGKLHRCFSIFIFNNKGELMLQKRADTKYHSPGLWSNTCCSHPCPGKNILQEAQTRLKQEMGFSCPLKQVFTFIYKAQVKTNPTRTKEKTKTKTKTSDPPEFLTEHEFDHVFFGVYSAPPDPSPNPDPTEASAWKYIPLPTLKSDITLHPHLYTPWLKTCLPNLLKFCKVKNNE